MPNTAKGTPYVISTDLVADYPTTSSALATHIDDNLAYNAVTINAQTGTTYTFALADASAGKLVTATNAGSQTYTVPPQSSVTWADGAVLRILNQGAGVVTIAAGAGVTINGTPLTLNQYSGAALQRTASNTWTIIPFTGGVGNANFSDAATGTYTSGGVNYKYKTYTASGTITIDKAGFADVLVVAGGGGGAAGSGATNFATGGGGAGGHLYELSVYLPAATHTVTVGAGGGGCIDRPGPGYPGQPSRIGNVIVAVGGGPGEYTNSDVTSYGGSGGGGAFLTAGGTGLTGQGNNGGSATSNGGGGGGGAGAVGSNGGSNIGGAGGAGSATALDNASTTRAGGGGGGAGTTGGAGGTGGGGAGTGTTGSPTAGTANTGGGGGGSGANVNGAAGGSGIVIVRVKV